MGRWAERERERRGAMFRIVSYCLVLFRVSLCPVVPETRVMSCWSLVSCEATRNATRNATDYEQMTEDSATWKRQRLAPSCVAASSKIGLCAFLPQKHFEFLSNANSEYRCWQTWSPLLQKDLEFGASMVHDATMFQRVSVFQSMLNWTGLLRSGLWLFKSNMQFVAIHGIQTSA